MDSRSHSKANANAKIEILALLKRETLTYISINLFFILQAFSVLSDKLTPLVDGVRENKVHWLQLAQNAQNNPNRLSIGAPQSLSMNNNNNNNNDTISDSKKGQKIESNGGIITDSKQIPKIVGKLGRYDSQIFYQKQNGSIGESRDHTDEAMDQ